MLPITWVKPGHSSSQHLSSTLAHSDTLSTLQVSPPPPRPLCDPAVTQGASPGISPGHPHLSLYSFPQSLMQLPSSSNCSLNLKSSLSSLHQCFSRTPTLASKSFRTDQYIHPSCPLDQTKLHHTLSQSVFLCYNLNHVSKRNLTVPSYPYLVYFPKFF